MTIKEIKKPCVKCKKVRDIIFELKQDAWESDRNADAYSKGYWWGIYWACLEIEKDILKDD